MSERLIRGALTFFLVAALLGAAFAIVGPAPFVRLLGLVALAGAAAGCAVQLYALRTFAPDAYAELRARMVSAVSRDATDTAMVRAA